MMKILALIGSPRIGGNTDVLVDHILKGSASKGHLTEKLHLYDFNIMPCIDCRRCKKENKSCEMKDDMPKIYPKLQEADLIIFGTPVYWYGPSAKMKLLIDRLRPFIDSKGLKGKRGIVVAPSEEGKDCCGPLMEMFRMSFSYLGMEFSGSILAKAYERGEIKENKDEITVACEMGSSF